MNTSMSLHNQFKSLQLSADQENALDKLTEFFNSSTQVFLLKGYAGSGKTTIIKGIVEYLNQQKIPQILMAPTGRAAKILRDKTSFGVTIHKAIYNFVKLESINQNSQENAEHSFHYFFPIHETDENNQIIIVDESSMISSKESNHELFTFGTNILLNDLLTFSRLHTTKNKIIFVGDPAQLPPVSDNLSLALKKEFFISLGISTDECEMKTVLRQKDNLILENATKIRELLTVNIRNELKFTFDNHCFVKIAPEEIIEKFTSSFTMPEIGDGVILSYSNAQCYHYNHAIRKIYFPQNKTITAGDLLLINNNNYHTYGVELFNGDFAKVISVSPDLKVQSAPVYCDENGKKVKKIIEISFRKIDIRIPNHHEDIQCYIIESLLNSINKDLTINEMKALYINFVIRFREKQELNKVAGLNYFKVGSEEFKGALKIDPFFNALKVKFGYAITCHKAQGGEWDTVFVDYHGRVSLKDDPLRWCYTATTRGISTLYALNPPNFGKLDKFKFNEIGHICTIPNEALFFENVEVSPFHKPDQHKCKSSKYWEILEKLENTPYKIEKVETFGTYLERYSISNNDTTLQVQASHKNSGHFIDQFKILSATDNILKEEIEHIFNASFSSSTQLTYIPENSLLEDLHSMMQGECAELDIQITNVVKGKAYYVTYYLITDSACALIQFYYNGNGQLTTAMPKTFNCQDDVKLKTLINKISLYAV
jgi:tRNA uridine 5-carbamoylmethylation protein Kti12